MSKGRGRLQVVIARAFSEQPERAFTNRDFLNLAFPDAKEFNESHRVSLHRAARAVADEMGWIKHKGAGGTIYYMRPETAAARIKQAKAELAALTSKPSGAIAP